MNDRINVSRLNVAPRFDLVILRAGGDLEGGVDRQVGLHLASHRFSVGIDQPDGAQVLLLGAIGGVVHLE